MSLICAECNRDMGPTNDLPGRDGVAAFAKTMSLVWIPTEPDSPEQWCFNYVLSSDYRSLCFRCIEAQISASRIECLQPVYEFLEAQTTYHQIENSRRGLLVGGSSTRSIGEAAERINTARRSLVLSVCLLCGGEVQCSPYPYFVASGFQRAYCRGFQSTWDDGRNYAMAAPPDESVLTMCNVCVKQCFPKWHRVIGSDLSGRMSPVAIDVPGNVLLVEEGALAAIEDQIGVPEAQRVLGALGAQIVGP